MARGWRGRGRGWVGPWPGRGPFSYLPPWQRPGWLFGRGACWWLFGPYAWGMWANPLYWYFRPWAYPWTFWSYGYPYMAYSLHPGYW